MRPTLSIREVILATLQSTQQIAAPTLSFAAAFVIAFAVMVWGAGALPENMVGSVGFLTSVLLAIGTFNLFSAAMYRNLVPSSGSLQNAAWKLTLAWGLIVVIAAILCTAIILFFSLIGSSLGVVSGEPGQDITDMTAQMRESGTFYPLFALFMLTLIGVFWFAVRMMLFAAATAARGSVHVFRTWAWTKRYALPMSACMIIFVLAPMTALGFIASGISDALSVSQSAALVAGIAALCHVPAAWLGHAFAATVYVRIAPSEPIAG